MKIESMVILEADLLGSYVVSQTGDAYLNIYIHIQILGPLCIPKSYW